MTDSASQSLVAGLELLLAAVHADDPKREILVRVGDSIRESAIVADHIERQSRLIAEKDAEIERLKRDCEDAWIEVGILSNAETLRKLDYGVMESRALSAESSRDAAVEALDHIHMHAFEVDHMMCVPLVEWNEAFRAQTAREDGAGK